MNETEFYRTHADLASNHSTITPEAYTRYNVKRGLRNDDGTGVLVGLTEIGDVHGYIIDEGEKIPVDGRLRYRGIDIRDIVTGFQRENRFGFEETAYLLMFGRLPNARTLDEFSTMLAGRRETPPGYWDEILRAPSSDIMNTLGRAVLNSYLHDPEAEDYSLPNIIRQCIDLVARIPVMAAYAYQAKRRLFHNDSLYVHSPIPSLSTAENLLQMIRPDRKFTQLEAETLDLALVLHAEHGGGNNSAFTVHVVSSASTDTYAALSAAIGSLKGSRHGGANIKVVEMIQDLETRTGGCTDDGAVLSYLEDTLRGLTYDHSGLIYGMGHAIYTKSDPRAILLKAKAEQLANEFGEETIRRFELYRKVEVLSPEAFRSVKKTNKHMCANVDLYSGFVYHMLGIPRELFTPIFAVSRMAGWAAHRIEELSVGSRIIRPAYKNVLGSREYLPMPQRSS